MENEYSSSKRQRGRSRSRASSTSSSLEVRCACQYYKSDSLLPERSALAAVRPASRQTGAPNRMVQTPPAGRKQPVRCGDHEYEPVGTPAIRMAVSQHSVSVRMVAPVVKITDTDVIPVVDSDDSIDDRYRFQQRVLYLEGDVVLPLDGRIEDNAMDGRNLGDQTIDTSADELESPQELQDRLEARFLTATTPGGESRTDAEINTSQVDSSMIEELPLRRGARGFQQKLKCQAGKIRSRFKNIQKPTFSMPHSRGKVAKKSTTSTTTVTAAAATTTSAQPTVTAAKPPSSPRSDQKASRMERFRMALPERPRFSLPDKSKFHLPDKSKFHLPDKSKFHLPERPKLNLPDKSKFHIKKPNIQLPKSFSRPKKSESERASQSREQSQASNAESNVSSKRNIFDFSTYPRPKLFDRKSKTKAEYVTSSPKESRSQSAESSTFPRAKKSSLSLSARWAQRFGETRGIFHDDTEISPDSVVDRSKPWRHPSLEQPRLSLKPQTSEEEEEEKLPWENSERRTYDAEDEAVPDEEEEKEISYEVRTASKEPELLFEKEPIKDPRLYDEQLMKRIAPEEPKKRVRLVEDDEGSIIDPEAEDDSTYHPKELYDGSFPPVDPREFIGGRDNSVEMSEEEEESMRSDREIQQSSGSSCERRRRGVIEEIDSDEFFLREKGISQENMRFHLMSEIRDALRPRRDEIEIQELPPQRPKRTRSQRKRKEQSIESFDATPPPEKPKRERGSLHRSQESFGGQATLERANSLSTHRIVYQTETPAPYHKDKLASEPLDDIVVVKPARRKSKSSLRSQSQSRLPPEEQNIVLAPIHPVPQTPPQQEQPTMPLASVPPVPCRRKRLRRDQSSSLSIRTVDSALCNGYGDNNSLRHSHERIPPTPPPTPPPLSQRDFDGDRIIHHIDELDYIEPAAPSPPVPPKRTRSHSRGTSLAPEDDRTSHGAESLPGDFGYIDDELPVIPRDSSSREPSLPGYAVIEKKEKPPRPPPPRRKRQEKFATAPRPSKNGPKRPQRAYSTLRPAKSDTIRKSTESMPFIDADYSLEHDDEDFHKDLRSGEVLIKMQSRPLPAPPRPPRHRRDPHQRSFSRRSLPREITPDFSETVASTQTDPLPDDLIIEEEITTAKLVVAPSRSGSTQVLISTERVPSPTSGSYKSLTTVTPPIPPLPSQAQQRDADRIHAAEKEESERKIPPSDETRRLDPSQLEILRSALFSTEGPLRIPSLEVGDLKVERLTVSQLEAYKVAASEIDAIVVSATELSNSSESKGGIHPSLLQELIAIRNQLEAVAASQPLSRPQSAMEDASTATSNERIDAALEELSREKVTDKRPFTRESSPLLFVQQPPSATVEMGRTVFPLSTSLTDLTSTSDSVTVSDTTILAAEFSEEPVSIVELFVEEPIIAINKLTTTAAVPTIDPPTTDTPTEVAAPTTATPTTTTTTTTTESSTIDPPVIESSPAELPIIATPSRSRSSSPSRGLPGVVRQTASPVKSMPPAISVTPDSIITSVTRPDNYNSMPLSHVTSNGVQPQRALISYRSSYDQETTTSSSPASCEKSQSPPPPPSSPARESSRSPPPAPPTSQQPQQSPPPQHTQFIAFPTSQIPPEFFALANPPLSSSDQLLQQQQQRRDVEVEPSIADMIGQLLGALRHAGTRSLRHFVHSVVSRYGSQDEDAEGEEKVRRVELAMCVLLIIIAVLIVVCICTPRTITHHHHWDYFNPPQ